VQALEEQQPARGSVANFAGVSGDDGVSLGDFASEDDCQNFRNDAQGQVPDRVIQCERTDDEDMPFTAVSYPKPQD
jgi:hypothetical protein